MIVEYLLKLLIGVIYEAPQNGDTGLAVRPETKTVRARSVEDIRVLTIVFVRDQ